MGDGLFHLRKSASYGLNCKSNFSFLSTWKKKTLKTETFETLVGIRTLYSIKANCVNVTTHVVNQTPWWLCLLRVLSMLFSFDYIIKGITANG